MGVAVQGLCAATFAQPVPANAPTTRPVSPTTEPHPKSGSSVQRWLDDRFHDLDRRLAEIDPRITPKAFSPTLYWENDGGATKIYDPTDRHYTAGAGFSIQWQSHLTNDIVSGIPSLDDEFAPDQPDVTYASGIIGSLRMYTPRDLSQTEPMFDDRPYAGWTYVGLILQRANRDGDTPTMEHLELDLGTMGPRSQAGYTQYSVHGVFDEEEPLGWRFQVQNEYGADLKYQRRWRMDLMDGRDGKPALQLLPYADATLGTIHINGSAGAVLRYGVSLPDDFGPSRQDWPGDFTSPLAGQSSDSGFYVFVRPAGRVVLHDATMGNSFFHDNIVEVDPFPFVFEVQVGFAAHFSNHVKITFSQTFNSLEFEHQQQWDSYGTLVLSGEWTW